jgi:hypothetical protein
MMNKNLQPLVFVIVSVISIIAIISSFNMANAQNLQEPPFHAKLSGLYEVPPIATPDTGTAQFKASPDGKTLNYNLTVNNIPAVTMAHIHQGKLGIIGQPVAPLSVGNGTITSSNLQGPLAGKQISDLVNLLKSGNSYVNVHTQQNQNGDIRGQIINEPLQY